MTDPAPRKPTRTTRANASQPAPEASADTETGSGADQAAPAAPATTPTAAPAQPKATRAKAAAPEKAATSEPVAEPVAAAPAEPVVAPAPAAPAAAAPAAAVAPAVGTAAPAAAAPAVAAPAAASSEPAAAPDTGPGAPGAPARPATPDVAAAVDKAIDRLRQHLTLGEIVAGAGAVIILAVAWLLFGFVFGHEGTWPSQLVLISSAGLLAVLVVHNTGRHDFGTGYRLIVLGLGLLLGFLAVQDILFDLRGTIDGRTFDIGGLTWWVGAVVAAIGGWLVWREDH